MKPDIRWPLGILFTVIGLLLIASGTPGTNVNRLWGAVLMISGIAALCAAWVNRKTSGGA